MKKFFWYILMGVILLVIPALFVTSVYDGYTRDGWVGAITAGIATSIGITGGWFWTSHIKPKLKRKKAKQEG
ncbi:hypothetical protein D3C71_1277540 [compost metagenome]